MIVRVTGLSWKLRAAKVPLGDLYPSRDKFDFAIERVPQKGCVTSIRLNQVTLAIESQVLSQPMHLNRDGV